MFCYSTDTLRHLVDKKGTLEEVFDNVSIDNSYNRGSRQHLIILSSKIFTLKKKKN